MPGITSALAARLSGGHYIDVSINRTAAARNGPYVADVLAVVSGAIGGEADGRTVEGLARNPISVRQSREIRDSVDDKVGDKVDFEFNWDGKAETVSRVKKAER